VRLCSLAKDRQLSRCTRSSRSRSTMHVHWKSVGLILDLPVSRRSRMPIAIPVQKSFDRVCVRAVMP
jgi:hypothetical protein